MTYYLIFCFEGSGCAAPEFATQMLCEAALRALNATISACVASGFDLGELL